MPGDLGSCWQDTWKYGDFPFVSGDDTDVLFASHVVCVRISDKNLEPSAHTEDVLQSNMAGKAWWQEWKAAGGFTLHPPEEREMDKGTQPAFSFSFILDPRPHDDRWYH